MVLIIGGRAQGKRVYAQTHYRILPEEWQEAQLLKGRAVLHLEEAVREREPAQLIEELRQQAERFPDTVFVCNEIGCGIVPMKWEERIWREHAGRLLREIASCSEEVIRVYCGIGVKIK